MSDIDTAVVDSLKVLDPDGPIREADIVLSSVQTTEKKLKNPKLCSQAQYFAVSGYGRSLSVSLIPRAGSLRGDVTLWRGMYYKCNLR